MNKIKQALAKSGRWTQGDVNAMYIFKGYNVGTGRTGWHVVPFGLGVFYIGATVAEAVDDIAARYE